MQVDRSQEIVLVDGKYTSRSLDALDIYLEGEDIEQLNRHLANRIARMLTL